MTQTQGWLIIAVLCFIAAVELRKVPDPQTPDFVFLVICVFASIMALMKALKP